MKDSYSSELKTHRYGIKTEKNTSLKNHVCGKALKKPSLPTEIAESEEFVSDYRRSVYEIR